MENMKRICSIGVAMAPSFLKGRSHVLPLIQAKDGFILPSGSILQRIEFEEKTASSDRIHSVSLLVNTHKVFTVKLQAPEDRISAFISILNYASSMKFPICLKQFKNLLMARVFSSGSQEADGSLCSFFQLCVNDEIKLDE